MHDLDVVGISTLVEKPDYHSPWKRLPRYSSGGTGVRVGPGKVLTAAHIVSHAVEIIVRLVGAPNAHRARVVYIDLERDLALLDVRTEREATELTIDPNHIPRTGDSIAVAEYDPSASRVHWRTHEIAEVGLRSYATSRRMLLALTTREPLPGGFSGSPAYMDGRFVGLALQTDDNEGDLIPASLVARFLEHAKAGITPGVPDLGIEWQKLENEDLRRYLRVSDFSYGIVVNATVFGGSTDGILQANDVITRMGDWQVASDGSIQLSNGMQLPFDCFLGERRVGERLELEIVRDGRRMVVTCTLKDFQSLVPLPTGQTRFVMHAGLVFMPLTVEYMFQWPWEQIPFRYKTFLYDIRRSFDLMEVVIISRVLPHSVNAGYQSMFGMRVTEINQRPIRSLADVPEALNAPNGAFHVIHVDNPRPRIEDVGTSEYGRTLVFDVERSAAATTELLGAHAIVGTQVDETRP